MDELNRRLESIQYQCQTLDNDKKRLTEECGLMQGKYDDLNRNYKGQHDSYCKLEEEIKICRETVCDYEQKNSSTETKYQETNHTIRDLQAKYDQIYRDNVSLRNEINDERDRVRLNKRDFDKQLRDHQRSMDTYTKSSHEKEMLIEELKSKRTALENEIEQLKRELTKQKDDVKKVQRDRELVKQEYQDSNRMIQELQDSCEELRHSKILIEEEYKITIEKYVKEIRETHIKLTKVETELKTTTENQQYDQEERYKRLQIQLQQERDDSRKQIYDREQIMEKMKLTITSQEQEVKRLKREIEKLEQHLHEAHHSSHSSSLVISRPQPTVETQIVVPSQESHSVSSFEITPRQQYGMQDILVAEPEKNTSYQSSFYRSTATMRTGGQQDLGSVDVVLGVKDDTKDRYDYSNNATKERQISEASIRTGGIQHQHSEYSTGGAQQRGFSEYSIKVGGLSQEIEPHGSSSATRGISEYSMHVGRIGTTEGTLEKTTTAQQLVTTTVERRGRATYQGRIGSHSPYSIGATSPYSFGTRSATSSPAIHSSGADEEDDELKYILEQSRSRRRRMKEDFSTSS